MTGHFKIGPYRPIYLWGGPGTIRMNRLKFMDQPVDEFAHHEAHAPAGAARVVGDMYCNWVHLTYDWGFPPEIEQEDWDDFERAAAVYHEAGSPVFAYFQSSNCVFDGSYRDKDWYARNAWGQKVYYYSGRYMTCLTHPEWVDHLKAMIKGAIERGADGVFLDNLWHGSMPLSLFNTWLGSAGCHCERCKAEFQAETGYAIPSLIQPDDPATISYLRWRADQVTGLIRELAQFTQDLRPGIPVSANDFDAITRSAYLIYGIDLKALAEVQDIIMIENFGLPHWDGQNRLANNALTVRTALPIVGESAHFSVLSYDVGIGFDGLYPERRYQQGIAEAAACGASMTIKGTEYFVDGQHTVLTPADYGPIHRAIGDYNRWLEAHTELYEDGRSAAPVGLLYPGEKLWFDWQRLAPVYFGAGQTLIQAGIPWRVVMPGDDWEGLAALLAFEPIGEAPAGTRVIDMLKLWPPRPDPVISKNERLRRVISRGAEELIRLYHGSRPARRIMDGFGMAKMVTQTPLYRLPPELARQSLLRALPDPIYPRLESRDPVLIEVWERGGKRQIHLVNYAEQPQTVTVRFGAEVSGKVISPDGEEEAVQGREVEMALDIYKVLVIRSL